MRKHAVLGIFFLLCGCESVPPQTAKEEMPVAIDDRKSEKRGRLFGDSALQFGGRATEEETGIGVNAYLWRGALKALSFLPIQSADPFGGVILSDWFVPQKQAHERFKVRVLLLTRQLRSDGVHVSITHQIRQKNGDWKEIPSHPHMIKRLEESILFQARLLKSQDLS